MRQAKLPFGPTTPHDVPSRPRGAPGTPHDALRRPHVAPGAPHVAPRTLHDTLDFVRHPRARRYVIRVRADGSVRVTIPRGGSKREARAFAEREHRWIDAEKQRVAHEHARSRETMPPEIERGLRERARRELPTRVLELATEHGLRVARVSVRNQRWRWGSCSRRGHICLNWRLVEMPALVRDYVIVHELMHLKRMDHSPAFWKLVARACPEYQAARAWLREYVRRQPGF